MGVLRLRLRRSDNWGRGAESQSWVSRSWGSRFLDVNKKVVAGSSPR